MARDELPAPVTGGAGLSSVHRTAGGAAVDVVIVRVMIAIPARATGRAAS
jgi:hypothetical protein